MTDQPADAKKSAPNYKTVALKDLARARKAYGADWKPTDDSAVFYTEQAKVHALLELADAIRASGK